MQIEKKFNIVIVGGGTAGWMTAAGLSQHFKQSASICLIDSAEIATVGVGEATIPTIRDFCRGMGLSDCEVLKTCAATCKLGIEFIDWHKPGEHFFHPFGLFGQNMANIDFHHYWLKQQQHQRDDFGEYSLAAQLAKTQSFTLPAQNPGSQLSVFDWAYHIDAGLFADLMRTKALANGVSHLDDKIVDTQLGNTGDIKQLVLQSGIQIGADLFIDCSGFSALLIEQALHTGFDSWQHWLLCDSAYAVQREAEQNLPPYTKVTAQAAGWMWQIPLQQRIGQGYVYSSAHISDATVLDSLAQHSPTTFINQPRKLSFVPGRRKLVWNKNCVAIGLSAGFLEPLESTSIALIQTAIERLKCLLTGFAYNQAVRDEFNQTTAQEYERVRDFLIVHYKLSQRQDSCFWLDCQNLSVPDSLEHKLKVFHSSGHLINYRWEIFHQPSWLAILFGFKQYPNNYDMRLDQMIATEQLDKLMGKMKNTIRGGVAEAFDHAEFIQQHAM